MGNLTILYFTIIIGLIFISAFFAAAETGFTSLSKGKIYKLKMGGNKKAELASSIRKDKDALIGAILLGNNGVNILASALATDFAIRLYGEQGVLIASVSMTVLVVVFAEVLPKTYAFYNSEKVALNTARPLIFIIKCLSPITKLVQIVVDFFLSIFGLSKKGGDALTAIDELRGTIELHHQEGKVIKPERDMLGSILDLTATEVGEIMVHRKKISTVNIDQAPSKFINQALSKNHTRIPIWKHKPDNIIGILHTKSLLKLIHKKKGKVRTDDILKIITQPWFVPETNTLTNQLLQFRKKRTHIAMVVDEYGGLVGLVTLEDILEEIVGQIDDEHDRASSEKIKKLNNGSVEVSGELPIRDLNRIMDWNLPDEFSTTIAGLIMHETGTIPNLGQKFSFYGFTFKIRKRKENQITKIHISVEKRR